MKELAVDESLGGVVDRELAHVLAALALSTVVITTLKFIDRLEGQLFKVGISENGVLKLETITSSDLNLPL
eukprot:CAMPEP_0170485062 /NCGR_PEP_ID=MMETSP0208-20121228/4402_1 /TAXON_ID=197538 /ORGANISM="Strombidium inclinatum, Strain S3" /LENGTH=70 /DNA_ID=CAMNT_0010758595 /DNA_START=353 /DNA_END=565 /DNA_ORIENTATION=-